MRKLRLVMASFLLGLAGSLAFEARAFDLPRPVADSPRGRAVNENLFRVYTRDRETWEQKSPAELARRTRAENEKTFRLMRREPVSAGARRLSRAEAQAVLDGVRAHPVGGEKAAERYDPAGHAGFCFGRALLVHLELRRRGVGDAEIGKLFAIGPLRANGAFWDYHVVTVVRGPGPTWWAVDAMEKSVMPVEEWARAVRKYEREPKNSGLRFFFTDAAKFQPHLGAYWLEDLSLPAYGSFFPDLLATFQK